MKSVTVQGVLAVIRHGYHVAGTVGAWTVTRGEHGWTLTASIVKTDTFRMSQRPLVFVAGHALGVWRWPITSLQMTGASLTAVLGPMEK